MGTTQHILPAAMRRCARSSFGLSAVPLRRPRRSARRLGSPAGQPSDGTQRRPGRLVPVRALRQASRRHRLRRRRQPHLRVLLPAARLPGHHREGGRGRSAPTARHTGRMHAGARRVRPQAPPWRNSSPPSRTATAGTAPWAGHAPPAARRRRVQERRRRGPCRISRRREPAVLHISQRARTGKGLLRPGGCAPVVPPVARPDRVRRSHRSRRSPRRLPSLRQAVVRAALQLRMLPRRGTPSPTVPSPRQSTPRCSRRRACSPRCSGSRRPSSTSVSPWRTPTARSG